MKRFLSVLVLTGALTAPGFAQDPADAPDHGVARISLLSGDVTVRRGDSGEEISAELNAPLVTRDHVLTSAGSRAEVQFDWANMIRLGPSTEIRIAELADRDFRVQLASGTITYRILRTSDAQVEISTPTASIHPKEKGTYRVEVRDDFSTEVIVRNGEADVFVGRDFSPLRSGQALLVRGDPANPERTSIAAMPRDEWDRWNESRDHDLERSDSYKYVSRHIYGAEDLDHHGRWVYDLPYGWVWVPAVSVGWAPYRVGRWAWVDFYGWTWLSGDPWGWAPYHYGRWYRAPRYGWVWYPGVVGPRYYWRPALVGFFGWGSRVGDFAINVGFGFGNVGWAPLAPYEVYRPWYGRNVTIVNVINNTNVINNYRNARFIDGRSGVTSVSAGDFGRRRITAGNFVNANDRDLSRAGEVRGRLPVDPSPRDGGRRADRSPTVRNDGGTDSRPNDRGFVTRPPVRDAPERGLQQQPRVDPPPESQREVRVRPDISAFPSRSNLPATRRAESRATVPLTRNEPSVTRNAPGVNAPPQAPSEPARNRASIMRLPDRGVDRTQTPRIRQAEPQVQRNESPSIRSGAPAVQNRRAVPEGRSVPRTSTGENPGFGRSRR